MKRFKTEDEFRDWCRVYRETFATPGGQEVLKDMLEWAGFLDDCVETDSFRLGVREGRRQVVLRIMRNLHLNLDEIFAVYSGRSVQLQEVQS